jgi:hypothetical protein
MRVEWPADGSLVKALVALVHSSKTRRLRRWETWGAREFFLYLYHSVSHFCDPTLGGVAVVVSLCLAVVSERAAVC